MIGSNLLGKLSASRQRWQRTRSYDFVVDGDHYTASDCRSSDPAVLVTAHGTSCACRLMARTAKDNARRSCISCAGRGLGCESFLHPVVIMFSVPLAAFGGMLGRFTVNLFTLQPLDVLTMLDFIILVGTVVNNAILIVHQSLNHMKVDEMAPHAAIREAVENRIRPIFMSVSTSVFGMLRLVIFPGAGAELLSGLRKRRGRRTRCPDSVHAVSRRGSFQLDTRRKTELSEALRGFSQPAEGAAD